MTKCEPLEASLGVSAEVSEMRPASALPESTNCAAWAMFSAVTRRGLSVS
jgi:hypothetical protein